MGNEQGQTPTTPEPGAPAQAATPVASVEPESATFDAVYVKALRSEAASYRKKLAELEATRKLEDDAKLTEQERVNKRLAELEPLTETVKAYETVMAEMLESRLTGLTPEAKKAVE